MSDTYMLTGTKIYKGLGGTTDQYIINTGTLEYCQLMLGQMVALGQDHRVKKQTYHILRVEPVELWESDAPSAELWESDAPSAQPY